MSGSGGTVDQYNSGEMAKDWRSQLKSGGAPSYDYPQDNDSEYYVPKKPVPGRVVQPAPAPTPAPVVPQYTYPKGYKEDLDSGYDGYVYPKYDPDADNEGYGGTISKQRKVDKYGYPIYLD